MKLIISEVQAERIGEERTGGKRGKDFRVFLYIHKQSKLSCFGVQICKTGETIAVA